VQTFPVGLIFPGPQSTQAVCSSFGSWPGGQASQSPAAEYVSAGQGSQAVWMVFGPKPAGHALQKMPSDDTKYAGHAVQDIE
jgi:hypothetical protein